MRQACEDAVAESLGRSLRPGEAKTIDNAVALHQRLLAREDPQAWMALSPQERLQQGAKAAAEAMTTEVKRKQEIVRLKIAAHDRIENALNDAFDRMPEKVKPGDQLRVVSQLLAFDAKGKGLVSAETWSHAIANEAFGRLLPLWNSVHGFAGLFENSDGVHDLVKELFGEDSGNAAAKQGAAAWKQVTEELRDRANSAGMDVGKLDEWRYPQNWSQARVAGSDKDPSKALENWLSKMMPLLDRSKYLNEDGSRMNDERVNNLLTAAFDTIATDGHNKIEPGTMDGYGLTSNRKSPHRALFFKDSDSYLAAQGEFGDRNIWSTLTGHIRSISRDIALNETLGPDAEGTFKYFNDRAKLDELRQAPSSKAAILKAHAFNDALFDTVSGKTNVVNQKIQDRWQAWRNFQVATKLGKVVITALGDEAGMSSTAFANGIPWSETFAREFKYLNPANSKDRDIAASAGLGINGIIGGLNRFGSEDLNLGGGNSLSGKAREFTAKLANGVMHASGAEAMWDARRRALGSVLMSYLGKTVQDVEHFSDINQADHGILANKGVTENDWQVWRLAEPEDWGMKHGVLTPKAIQAIPDERLEALGNPVDLRRHASTMLLGHVLEETGMGVMDTGARERLRMTFGTTAGTTAGELTRALMLFKGFSASMMMKHWARAQDMPTTAGAWTYGARLVVAGTIMGALANQLRNLTAGKNPENIAEPQFWGTALLRGGGLGFYGDFLYSEVTSHDTSLIPGLMGPLGSDTEAVWNLTGAAALKHMRGERTDEGGNLIRFAKSEVPFLNMWYTQAAMDHILWNEMQESVSPGYLDRMQLRAQTQRGQTYYWDPHDNLPSQGPDFAKLIQPERGAEQMSKIADTLSVE